MNQRPVGHPPTSDAVAASDVLPPHPDVVWRHAPDGRLYLLHPGRRRIFCIDGLDLVNVEADEVKRVFGDSSDAVVRISNQI